MEVSQLEQVFQKFDKDGDGFINREELVKAMTEGVGKAPTEEEVQQFMDEVDTNGDGMLSMEEFKEFASSGSESMKKSAFGSTALGVFGLASSLTSAFTARSMSLTGRSSKRAPEDPVKVAAKEIFKRFDTDESGKLDKAELRKLLAAFVDEQKITLVDGSVDTFMDGQYVMKVKDTIDLAEFTVWYEALMSWNAAKKEIKDMGMEEEIRHLFDEFDKDGSGKLDVSELRQLSFELGETMTKEDAAATLQEIDVDASGQIDFKEFLSWFVAKPKNKKKKGWKLNALKSKLWARAVKRKMTKGIKFANKVGDANKDLTPSGQLHKVSVMLGLGEVAAPKMTSMISLRRMTPKETHPTGILGELKEKSLNKDIDDVIKSALTVRVSIKDDASDELLDLLVTQIKSIWTDLKADKHLGQVFGEEYQSNSIYITKTGGVTLLNFTFYFSVDPNVWAVEASGGLDLMPLVQELCIMVQSGFSISDILGGDMTFADHLNGHTVDVNLTADTKIFETMSQLAEEQMKAMMLMAQGMKEMTMKMHWSVDQVIAVIAAVTGQPPQEVQKFADGTPIAQLSQHAYPGLAISLANEECPTSVRDLYSAVTTCAKGISNVQFVGQEFLGDVSCTGTDVFELLPPPYQLQQMVPQGDPEDQS